MASKAYIARETVIEFLASGGDVTFTLTSLAADAGRQSAQHDFGASSRAASFEWRGWVQFATTPVIGETVDIYLKTSDGTHIDNDDGTGDIDVSAEDKLDNLKPIGSIIIDETTADLEFSASGVVYIPYRYINIIFWNSASDVLTATASEHGFSLTPIPLEAQ